MTFDNADELVKIRKHHPKARLVLRLAVDDRGSLCRFSTKFGAQIESVVPLLRRARDLDLDVVGVSFHVGSGCTNPWLYDAALKSVKWTFEKAKEFGYELGLVDIGGGFEGHTFTASAEVIRLALDKYFPAGEPGKANVRVIAEPGRFFVSDAFEIATNVIARRGVDEEAVASAGEPDAEAERPVTMCKSLKFRPTFLDAAFSDDDDR
jgi:ornithine decarboxylase